MRDLRKSHRSLTSRHLSLRRLSPIATRRPSIERGIGGVQGYSRLRRLRWLLVWIVGNHGRWLRLRSTPVATAVVVHSLVLYFEALIADLEAVHLFNR